MKKTKEIKSKEMRDQIALYEKNKKALENRLWALSATIGKDEFNFSITNNLPKVVLSMRIAYRNLVKLNREMVVLWNKTKKIHTKFLSISQKRKGMKMKLIGLKWVDVNAMKANVQEPVTIKEGK